MAKDLAGAVLSLSRFSDSLTAIALKALRTDLPVVTRESATPQVDWNFSLMCASALTPFNDQSAQDAVLRISQGCLSDPETTDPQRAAAILLLDRTGNQPAINLARKKQFRLPRAHLETGLRLSLDALARKDELTVLRRSGTSFPVNPFQQMFWVLAQSNEWVSVSAPTSAGKSHIVREWMLDELDRSKETKLVYIAPTRALVEEVGEFFRSSLGADVGVHTLPWDPDIPIFKRQIFVLTQERLHLLQHRLPHLTPRVIFVDEAQKISEGSRGILLSRVLDEAVTRDAQTRIIFASPLSANPGVLLDQHDKNRDQAALVGETVTVSQNLMYVNQVHRKPSRYSVALAYRGLVHEVGTIELAVAPDGAGQKVPLVAVAVAGVTPGNLVYANGPAEAEKYARTIYDSLGPDADLDTPAIQKLIDFSKGVVHERFALAELAVRGVAFHYGDMPLVLKAKVEELFKAGALRYLVCTSTLLEGVNLPCRNIFMRGPRKGKAHMSMGDFWNLAGRAGRWGKEFHGNIFCIDTVDARAWPELPGRRERTIIESAASKAFADVSGIVSYIEAGAQKASRDVPDEIESAYSWMAGRFLEHETVGALHGVILDRVSKDLIDDALRGNSEQIRVSSTLIRKHAGISPLSMQRLLDAVVAHGSPHDLALVPPTSDDAFTEYKLALDLVAEHLGGSFEPEMRRRSLARLIVHWMRGRPLSMIIDNRASNLRSRGEVVNYPRLIRKVMEDVEDIARFEAPRYLSCYSDIVALAAEETGGHIDTPDLDIAMMLELGVPRMTDMSFIAIGLSRATSRAIAPMIVNPSMSPRECRAWVADSDLESLDLPQFAVREIQSLRVSES